VARFLDPVSLAAIDIVHAESAGFSPRLNVATLVVEGRMRASDEWRVLAKVEYDQPVARDRIVLDEPSDLEWIRMTAPRPNFLAGGDTARIAEVVFWGTVIE